jgi:hypothetical protein
LNHDELFNLISLLTGTTDINIFSSPIISGCCCTEKCMFYTIDRIIIKGKDLHIAYNDVYNTLRNFHISLKSVIPSSLAF